jgi:hypothetical protein
MTPKFDWRHLAEQASNELHPNKLMALVDELNQALEEQEAARRQRRGFIGSLLPVTPEPLVA